MEQVRRALLRTLAGVPGVTLALGARLVAGAKRKLTTRGDQVVVHKPTCRNADGPGFAPASARGPSADRWHSADADLVAERAVALRSIPPAAAACSGTGRPRRAETGRTGAHLRPAARSLRDALRAHPAGPELLAALGPVADRLLPARTARWSPARWEAFIDASLDEARARSYAARRARQRALRGAVPAAAGSVGAASVRVRELRGLPAS